MGQLFLQKGNWNGQQILPEEWVKGGICRLSALTARRHETGDAEESEDERQDKRLAAGLRLPDIGAAATTPTVPMVPTDNTYWCCRTGMPSLPSPPTSPDMQAELNLIWKYLLPAL